MVEEQTLKNELKTRNFIIQYYRTPNLEQPKTFQDAKYGTARYSPIPEPLLM